LINVRGWGGEKRYPASRQQCAFFTYM